MRRRAFVAGLSAAAGMPLGDSAFAQQRGVPIVGFLNSRSHAEAVASVEAFRKGLAAAGFVEGRNVAIEFRWAEGRLESLAQQAADLAQLGTRVFMAGGGNDPVLAAMKAAPGTPIVFSTSTDPVDSGLVQSLNRPGGNVTGVSFISAALEAKRLGMLLEVVPHARFVGLMFNPRYAAAASQRRNLLEAVSTLKLSAALVEASSEAEIESAFGKLAAGRAEAVMVATDVFFVTHRANLIANAARYRIPAIYSFREYALSGGLMSYGPSVPDGYALAGQYVARILKGERPSDLPVVQPTRFHLVLNLRTAAEIGLTFPDKVLALADEVIE